MADEARSFIVTVPHGQYSYQPSNNWVYLFHQDLSIPPRIVKEIMVRVPPGPCGQMGFRFESGGAPVIPCQSDQWIIADDETIDLHPSPSLDSGSWQIAAWNNGGSDHSVFITFFLDAVKPQQQDMQLINF